MPTFDHIPADTHAMGGSRYNRVSHKGVRISLNVRYHNFGAPAAAVANGLSVSATITAPAAAVLGGSLTALGIGTFDIARNVVGAWTNAAVVTVVGTDIYGSLMSESSASGTAFTGKKAFKTIISITPSVTVTAATFGSGDVLGLPHRVDANALLAARAANAIDAGTFVPADTTNPATAITGDVRGTFDPAVALNAANTVGVFYAIADSSSKQGAYGIKQFGSTDAE